ncbi:MAG: AAA family ATPase [Saprospiraceae bacterium]|nr:AAA family ATPase [Saprospiraceae bacterium]
MKQPNSICLILIAGLPGTGKTTLARAFVQRYGGRHINSDLLRKAMNLKGHYGQEDKKKVYEAMLESTRATLTDGKSVVVDSTFVRESVRAPFEAVARDCGVPFFWVEMKAEEHCMRERLQTPRADSEADFSVFLALLAQSEPIRGAHLELWSDRQSLEAMVHSVHNFISSILP